MPFMLIAFIVIPIIEIALFVQLGGAIGLWTTLAIVLATALIGSFALRSQGRMMLRKFQQMRSATDMSDTLIGGLLLFSAGLLLITPGFLTDAIGLSLLVPPVRNAVARWLASRMTVMGAGFGAGPAQQGGNPPHDLGGGRRPDPDPRGGPASRSPNAGDAEDAVILEETPRREP